MCKIPYLIVLFIFFFSLAYSQDKIYKKNGDVVLAKIVEIGETEIKYKIFSDQEGPLYSVDKDRLMRVIYQSGREEVFQHSLKDPSLYADQARNAIKLNFIAPLLGYTQFNFERNIKPGRSYELSLGLIGLGKRQEIADYSITTGGVTTSEKYYRDAAGAFIGAGYKFVKLPNFIRNGDKYSHILQGAYAKPELIFGSYNQNKYPEYLYDGMTYAEENETVVMGAFIINLGKQWVFGDFFILDLYAGMGYAFDNQHDENFLDSYDGNHFGLSVAGESGVGFTGGLKIGMLLNKKKK